MSKFDELIPKYYIAKDTGANSDVMTVILIIFIAIIIVSAYELWNYRKVQIAELRKQVAANGPQPNNGHRAISESPADIEKKGDKNGL